MPHPLQSSTSGLPNGCYPLNTLKSTVSYLLNSFQEDAFSIPKVLPLILQLLAVTLITSLMYMILSFYQFLSLENTNYILDDLL